MSELEAGAALNRQIAERVMGLTLDWGHTEILGWINDDLPLNRTCNNGRGLWCSCPGCGVSAPANEMDWAAGCLTPAALPYSTDLVVAWAVLTHLEGKGWHFSLGSGYEEHKQVYWVELLSGHWWWYDPDQRHKARAATVPLAICRAALAALEGRA